MRHKIITSWLFFCCFLVSSSGQQPGPTAKEVVEKFYGTYDIYELAYGRVDFEKKKGDWYVKEIDLENDKIIYRSPKLFYDKARRSFLKLTFAANPQEKKVAYEEYLQEPEAYNFDIQPFYGYSGWYKDVIQEFNGKQGLSDTELYAFARAYSSQSVAPITNQGRDAPEQDRFKMPYSRNSFSPQQLKIFLNAADSGISKFGQLAVKNPLFQTRVGDMRDKYSNEIMFKFSILLAFSERDAKATTLPPNLYKDSTLNVARAYLDACPPQSVFLSFGDNDYYPVLYLQKAMQYRTDVFVLNYSLLGLDRFDYRLSYPQFDASRIELSVDTSVYHEQRNEIIYIEDSAYLVPFPDLIALLKKEALDNKKSKIKGNGIIMQTATGGVPPVSIQISLEKASYLLRHEWVLLDIINNLKGRQICFTSNFDDELTGLNDHLSYEKGLFLFRPKKK